MGHRKKGVSIRSTEIELHKMISFIKKVIYTDVWVEVQKLFVRFISLTGNKIAI